MADVKEPWEPKLVEELIGVGVENMKLTGGDDDRKKAMENVAEPIANAIKRARTSMKQPTFVAEVLVRQLNSIGAEGLQDYGIYKLTDGGYVMQPGGGDALRVDAGDCVLYIAETKSFVPWVESGGGGAATDFIVEGSQEIAVLKDLSIPGVKRFIVKFSSAFVRALAVLSAHLERRDNPHNVTAEQVGAASAESVAAAIDEHNASETAHADIRQDIENEAEARESADTALGGRIDDAEDAIENEAATRANADTALGGRIDDAEDAIDAEASERASADTALGSRINSEVSEREQADSELQAQIDAISSKSDVVDVVASYAELVAYDTSALGDNDVVKVLEDETQDNAESYYRWNLTEQTWGYIGSQGPFVTPAEMQTALNGKVDKVAGKGLSTNDFTDAAKAVTDNIFLATYNVTSYADIKAAYDAGKTILCRFTDSNHTLRVATFDRLSNSTTSTSYAYFASVTKADAYELVASKTRYGTTTTWSNTIKTWGALAEKDKVFDSDISETIQDAHIASASTWNAKQDALSVSDSSAAFSATTTIITALNNGATLVRNTAGRLWTWIESQADAIYAPISHSHDDRYYTESEVDSLLTGKQPTITGAATTIATSNLTANRALVSSSSGKVAVSAVTATELGYLDGVTSNVQTQLGNKVDKVSGKGLSTNDYTTNEKNKLEGIAAGAEVNVQSDWNQTNSSSDSYIKNKPTIPTSLSQLSTDSNNQRVSSSDKSTWNGKADTTGTYSGMTVGKASTAEALVSSTNDKAFHVSMGNNMKFAISFESSGDSYAGSILVQSVGHSNYWPSVFAIGFKILDGVFTTTPKVGLLYTTSHSTAKPTVKYATYNGKPTIFINPWDTSGERRKCFVSVCSRIDFEVTMVSTITGSDATFEGTVMKEQVGTAIGSDNDPVYVNGGGFITKCNHVAADSVDGVHFSLGALSPNSSTVCLL